jgi:hypothetical protein
MIQRMLLAEDCSGALDHDDGAAHAVDAVVAHTTQEHPVQKVQLSLCLSCMNSKQDGTIVPIKQAGRQLYKELFPLPLDY